MRSAEKTGDGIKGGKSAALATRPVCPWKIRYKEVRLENR